MKILMVVLVTILFAVVGGFVGGSMVDSGPAPAHIVRSGPRDRDREMMEAVKAMNAGATVMAQRQHNMMIGGGVGVVVGLAAGAFAASKIGTRQKR